MHVTYQVTYLDMTIPEGGGSRVCTARNATWGGWAYCRAIDLSSDMWAADEVYPLLGGSDCVWMIPGTEEGATW